MTRAPAFLKWESPWTYKFFYKLCILTSKILILIKLKLRCKKKKEYSEGLLKFRLLTWTYEELDAICINFSRYNKAYWGGFVPWFLLYCTVTKCYSCQAQQAFYHHVSHCQTKSKNRKNIIIFIYSILFLIFDRLWGNFHKWVQLQYEHARRNKSCTVIDQATWGGKMVLSWPLGVTCCVTQENSVLLPYVVNDRVLPCFQYNR